MIAFFAQMAEPAPPATRGMMPLFAVFPAVFAGVIAGGLYFLVARLRASHLRRAARQEVEHVCSELIAAFPAFVANAGGAVALRDPKTVARLREELSPSLPEATPAAVSEPVPVPAPEPFETPAARQTRLGVLLARMEKAHAELDDLRSWHVWETVVWGFFPALLVGWLAGEFTFSMRNQYARFPAAFGNFGNDWTANLIGVVAGLIVWFGYFWVIRAGVTAVAVDTRKRGEGIMRELARGFSDELAAWGGAGVLRDAVAVRRVRDDLALPVGPPSGTSGLGPDEIAADPRRKAMLVARVQELARRRGETLGNFDTTWGVLFVLYLTTLIPAVFVTFMSLRESLGHTPQFAGAAAAYVVVLLAWVEWSAMAAWRRSLARRWTEAVDGFLAEYPKLVSAWGGREVLHSPERTDAVLAALDPAAKTRPGFWSRMFGG